MEKKNGRKRTKRTCAKYGLGLFFQSRLRTSACFSFMYTARKYRLPLVEINSLAADGIDFQLLSHYINSSVTFAFRSELILASANANRVHFQI